ncbi:MAG TPA: hypothetical protein VKU02_27885 [Gemmataceae bacterium]|nr:hypothetical protein [Gemmataceae bacterium]
MHVPDSGFVRWRARAWLAVLLPSLLGCGGGVRATATVTGTVSYQGKPVPTGTVKFYGPDNQVASASIGEDGSYEATNVPLGSVKVAVSTPPPPPPDVVKAAKEGKRRFGKGNVLSAPTHTVSIPPKYSDPAKSGLGLTVIEGSQPYVIDLK